MTICFPPRDYVSPGLDRINVDFAFPNLVVGDPSTHPWPYLRAEVPHNWYVDQRVPWMGFLNRDEAHVIYNNALQFRGRRALEIGCWMGWSAAHMLAAGVVLDVVDPTLQDQGVRDSVISSLRTVGERLAIITSLTLHPFASPQKVEELSAQGVRWSLLFIDGDHEAPGPLNDAIVCERSAEPDAMVLFHDLASPEVSAGLDYFADRGWQTLVYQTMQIMGVAWRGQVQPVKHIPDPAVAWNLPPHLQRYSVSPLGQAVTS